MSIFQALANTFKDHFNKKKEEAEMMDRLRKEAEMERIKVFEEEFKKNAIKVAKAQAIKDAYNKSGIQKLRALNRVTNLDNPSANNPNSIFQKLSEYTQKNLARRDENLRKTEILRGEALRMKNQDMEKRRQDRFTRMNKTR